MMSTRDYLKKHLTHGVLVGVFAILLLRTGGGSALALALSCGQWNVIPSPNQGTTSQLNGVAVISPNDVWAVGYSLPSQNAFKQTLIEHWDGTQWSIVPSPNPGPEDNFFTAVSGTSATDVWAVGGFYNPQYKVLFGLVAHWDGTSWSEDSQAEQAGTLYGLVATAPNDAWSSGGNGVFHWNGSGWAGVHYVGLDDDIEAVTGTSTNDIWIVGYNQYPGGAVIEHWDGTQWSNFPFPNPGLCDTLYGATALATNDVWAVGYGSSCNHPGTKTLTEHWDGSKWRIIKSPKLASTKATFHGVAALSTNNVWAVGTLKTQNKPQIYQTLTEQWNGSAWSVVPSPNPGQSNMLNAVAASGSDLWAVGSADNSTLIELYC